MYDQKLYNRLIAKIRKDETTGCWLWTGFAYTKRPHPGNRYGAIGICKNGKNRNLTTHRAMMIALLGPLTREQCVCHKCDVPLCINPDHLFIGTMGDNIRDSRSKGRHYESRKDHCDRGHPLTGDNLYSPIEKGIVKRVCKKCATARYRMKYGWPEELAYSDIKVPAGYMMDRKTWTVVPVGCRRLSQVAEKASDPVVS